MKIYIGIVVILLLGSNCLFAQTTDKQKELLEIAQENYELLDTDREKAFNEAKTIEKQAQNTNAREAELKAIHTVCEYYKIDSDFENMMVTAKLLQRNAIRYKSHYYQLIAKRFLFEAYLFTGLPQRALQELRSGRELMNELSETDSLSILERSNFLIAYSNYYLLNEDYKNQLKYIKLAGKELKKLPRREDNQMLWAVYYSNLATSYNQNNERDSAAYYAKLSLAKNEIPGRAHVRFNNLMVLGNVEMHKLNFQEALLYLKEAETIRGPKNHIDIEELYDNIIEANLKLGRSDPAKIYRAKKDSLNLSISENRNRSLLRLLTEKDDGKTNIYLYILLITVIAMGFFTFFVVRKNRILIQQEKISQQYLEKVSAIPRGEDYSNLMKILRENDPAFMFHFEETFPEFSSKLSQINPEISASEAEFCALLKLKIPTKEIAQYKFIAPKTVRNRKYNIRKKLNIPKEVDIYQWFSEL